MATVYRIHPAIGIARVGNSPTSSSSGPNGSANAQTRRAASRTPQCRVKRQAARFRIFAHHDDGTVDEITDAEADITWTVHLVNKKAAHPARGNTGRRRPDHRSRLAHAQRDPNSAARSTPGVIQFSGGPATTVPLGEMRSDDEIAICWCWAAPASRPRRPGHRRVATSGTPTTGTTTSRTDLSRRRSRSTPTSRHLPCSGPG